MRNLLCTFLFLMLVCFGKNELAAQTTQASISGVITDDKSQPIPGASVQVRNESTGFTTSTITNAKGNYTFKELPLGTPYSITVKYIGFGQQKRTGYSLNQGDAIRINLTMKDNVQDLAVVEIVGSGMKNKTENLGAATTVSARDISRLPVNGRNFTSLTDLSPLSRGTNLSGQLGSSTNFTIDGTSAKNPTSGGSTTSRSSAPYSLSMEAVREFKVVTNQYDVTQGRAGGGTISAVTKSGTNTLTGSAFTYGRADWLASKYGINGNKRISDFSTYQYGFSLGGPIIKDKLHFFMAWDHQREARPLQIANIQTSADEARLKLSQTTLDNFVGIARAKYGVASSKQFGEFDKLRGSDAAFLRLDWQINEKNLLTVRDNYTNDRNNQGLEDNTAINLYESYGNDKNVDNNLLATLRTSISPRLTNELKAMHLYTYQQSSPGDQLPSANIPRAVVEGLASVVDGKNLTTNIQIGGHRFAQEGFTNNVFQLVDNLYFNTDKVKYTFGTDLMYTRAHSTYGSELNGKFYFADTQDLVTKKVTTALENFNNMTPYRYTREVPLVADPSVTQGIFNSALYAQMQAKLATGLEMTAGLRADYTYYPAAPLNQLVLDELGLRTDNSLSSFQIQPRVQFTLDVNEAHTDYVRFGAGIFGSDINNYATINNRVFDGTRIASVDVRTPNVPTPNFVGYRDNPSTAPGKELFDIPGVNKLITINTNASDARVPVVYKANASYNHFFTDKLRAGITGYATLARHNYMYVDRNMVTDPYFRLANEGGRGVYVPAASISSGAPDWQQGRISNKLGRVLEMNSKGKINQFAVVVDATYQYLGDGEITVSYTWNDTKDNTSYNGNVANTATLSLPVKDDPRDLSKMSYSDNQFRNKIVVYTTLPTFAGFSVGIRYTAVGGTRYSLLSGGNTNGDFVATNDLAYIFDVNDASVPQNVRTGLQGILDNPNASKSLKDYIRKYSGGIAERNGGVNGFYGTVDLRISKKFKIYKTHSLELSGDLFNVGNLLKKSWGVNESMGSQALYSLGIAATATTPRQLGFDNTTNQFVYSVNNTGIATPSGNPWQGQIGVRYSF